MSYSLIESKNWEVDPVHDILPCDASAQSLSGQEPGDFQPHPFQQVSTLAQLKPHVGTARGTSQPDENQPA